jgi:hypothetical protein
MKSIILGNKSVEWEVIKEASRKKQETFAVNIPPLAVEIY